MTLTKCDTRSISIGCEPQKLLDYVANPENLTEWCHGYCQSIKVEDGEWMVETTDGLMDLRVDVNRYYGIVDHYFTDAMGFVWCQPMRITSNGEGSEVLFTVCQHPYHSENQHRRQLSRVERGLIHLKQIMEKRFAMAV